MDGATAILSCSAALAEIVKAAAPNVASSKSAWNWATDGVINLEREKET
jgi:hypothetical protein